MLSMRTWLAIVSILCATMGCSSDRSLLVDANTWDNLKPKLPTSTPDVVELHYIFLTRDKGDKALDVDVWAEADEQAIPLDLKSSLNRNGLRVAKLGGRISPEVHSLLHDEDTPGQGRRNFSHSGALARLQLTEVTPECNLFVIEEGQPKGKQVADGQGYINATPTIGDGSTIHLALTPEVQYGPMNNRRLPSPDLTGWQIRNERDSLKFSHLTVDIELDSGDYVLIGPNPDCEGTIGDFLFNSNLGGKSQQTVVLVRVVRPSREELYSMGHEMDDFFLTPMPSLGSGRSSVRETLHASRLWQANDSR